MTDRLLEFRSACRLARRRLGVGPPTQAPLPALHTSLAARRARELSGAGVPYVLAGDFNVRPDSAVYEFLSRGVLEVELPRAEQPEPRRIKVNAD